MEQSISIVAQINRVVANEMMRGNAISLPTIGSLVVSRISSKLNSRGGIITPPRNVVKFSTQMDGVSLVDTIVAISGCDEHSAESLYAQWVESVKRGSEIVIEGVGIIANNNFKIDPKLDAMLNSELTKSFQLRRRRGGWVWIAASILICVVVGLGVNYTSKLFVSSRVAEEAEVVSVVEQVAPEPEMVEEAEVADSIEMLTCTTPPEVIENLKYRVVYGVFSTMENAQRGVAEAKAKSADVDAKIAPLGKKFMVTIFESNDADMARGFLRRERAVYHSELWLHERR